MRITPLLDRTNDIIYHAKQADDNLFRRHAVLLW